MIKLEKRHVSCEKRMNRKSSLYLDWRDSGWLNIGRCIGW